MPKLEWTIVCQRAIVDTSNNLSLIEIMEDVEVLGQMPEVPDGKTPLIPIPYSIVSLWVRSVENERKAVESRVQLVGPNGKKQVLVQQTIDLSAHGRVRAISRSMGLPFLGFGRYRFVAQFQSGKSWRSAGETSITFKLPEPLSVH